MKIILCIMFATSISWNIIFASDKGIDNFPEKLNENQSVRLEIVGVSDTCSRLTFLSFNTSKEELAPAFRNGSLYYIVCGDNQQRYYVFELESANIPGVEAQASKDGTSSSKKRKVNNELKNVYLNFSQDGKLVLVNTLDKKSKTKNLFIGKSEHMDDMKQLNEFPFNSRKYSIGRATISPDGNRLVFSSDKKGSIGGIDLWMSSFETGFWSIPVNLGRLVNTKLNEAMPYFVSNTRLYFASEGHTGYGKYDLYYTDWSGDGFAPPVNMGSLINSSSNEMGICFSEESGTYYFASNRRGNYDIYSYEPGEKQVKTVPLLASLPDKHVQPPPKPEEVTVSAFTATRQDVEESRGSNFINTDVAQTIKPVAEMENPVIPVIKEPLVESNDINCVESPKKIVPEKQLSSTCGNSKHTHYYSIQVIALKPDNFEERHFRKLIDPELEYFLVRENGWITIRTGQFANYKDAFIYAKEKGMSKFFVAPTNTDCHTEIFKVNQENDCLADGSKSASPQEQFYSIQLMSLKPEEYDQQYFKTFLNPASRYFVVREGTWVKIRTGHFSGYKKAFEYAKNMGFKNYLIIPTNEMQINEYL